MTSAAEKVLAGLAALAIVAAPVATGLVAQEQAPRPAAEPLVGDANQGRFVAIGGMFGDQRIDCLRCHGFAGTGDGSGAFPRLAGQSNWYLYKSLHDFASGARPSEIMGPIAESLTEAQMRDVTAYYASIEDASRLPPPEADVDVLQIGGAIAAVGLAGQGVAACSSCHGANGGGDFPVTPYLAGQNADYLERQLLLFKAGTRQGDPMGVMRTIAQSMTEDQIHAVSRYFATVQSDQASAAADEPARPDPQPVAPPATGPTPSIGLEPGPIGALPNENAAGVPQPPPTGQSGAELNSSPDSQPNLGEPPSAPPPIGDTARPPYLSPTGEIGAPPPPDPSPIAADE